MSRAELVKALTLAFAACAAASVLQESATQEPPDELTPRAISDSTYGVRVTVDALAETIRHGELDLRQLNDPELAVADGFRQGDDGDAYAVREIGRAHV